MPRSARREFPTVSSLSLFPFFFFSFFLFFSHFLFLFSFSFSSLLPSPSPSSAPLRHASEHRARPVLTPGPAHPPSPARRATPASPHARGARRTKTRRPHHATAAHAPSLLLCPNARAHRPGRPHARPAPLLPPAAHAVQAAATRAQARCARHAALRALRHAAYPASLSHRAARRLDERGAHAHARYSPAAPVPLVLLPGPPTHCSHVRSPRHRRLATVPPARRAARRRCPSTCSPSSCTPCRCRDVTSTPQFKRHAAPRRLGRH